MKKLKGPVIVLLVVGILWSAAFIGYFVGRRDALVEQAGLNITTMVGCAALIRDGDAQRAVPYLESQLSSDTTSLLAYRKFSGLARLVFEQLCHSVVRPSLKTDPFPGLAAYSTEYSDNQLGDGTRDFLRQQSEKR
jgi:hypothetical protein